MGMTIYSGTTLNGLFVSDMVDNSKDYIYETEDLPGYFIRKSVIFDCKEAEYDPERTYNMFKAFVLFSVKDVYKPLYAKKAEVDYDFELEAGNYDDDELDYMFDKEINGFWDDVRANKQAIDEKSRRI